MVKRLVGVAIFVLLLSKPLLAQTTDSLDEPPQKCATNQQVGVTISLNGTQDDIEQFPAFLKARQEHLRTLARKAGIDHLVVTNENYNLSSDYSNSYTPSLHFQYNVNLAYEMDSIPKAQLFAKIAAGEHYQSALSVSKNLDTACPDESK